MKIVTLTPQQFDNFAKKHRYRNYYQTTAYGKVMMKFNYSIHYLGIVNDSNKLIGASLIVYKEIFMNHKIAYAPRGPLLNYEDQKTVIEATKKLKKLFNKQGFMLLKIDPYIPKTVRNNRGIVINFNNKIDDINDNLRKAGYKYKGENKFFETENPRWEALVLLNRDTKEILAKLDRKTRNKIRKAKTNGVIILKNESKDINSLYQFMKKHTNKPISFYKEICKNFKTNVNVFYAILNTEKFTINSRQLLEREEINNNHLNNILQDTSINITKRNEYLSQKMQSDKLIDTYKNSIVQATNLLKKFPRGIKVGGCIVIEYDNAAYILCEGQNEKYRYLNPLYLLKWYLIEYYNHQGFKYINFNEIAGEFEKKHPYQELNDSKLGYDTTITEYIGEFSMVTNNFAYKIYQNISKK